MFLNHASREINLKIVYYGPGLAGKTTNVIYVHKRLDRRSKLVTLATESERTLYFDFLPVDAGKIRGYTVRLHLYTVPGQYHYMATRRLVMRAADGVVFVVDSQEGCEDRNHVSLYNLEDDIELNNLDNENLPRVIQYNKRDIPSRLPISFLRREYNPRGDPDFPAVARDGKGVFQTLKTIARLALRKVQADMGSPETQRRATG